MKFMKQAVFSLSKNGVFSKTEYDTGLLFWRKKLEGNSDSAFLKIIKKRKSSILNEFSHPLI
jgi:hypothetical protein